MPEPAVKLGIVAPVLDHDTVVRSRANRVPTSVRLKPQTT
jgi:hypothetical protein